MSIATFTKTGTKATTAAKLDKTVFGVTPKTHGLLKSAYEAYLANGRSNLATTKTRGLVRGGGKKPWRQKGTGRARAGSIRSPIWRGGGITFGPSGQESYRRKINVSAKRQAIRQALSLAAAANKLIVIEDLKIKDSKTAEAAKLLSKIGATKRTLVAVTEKSAELERSLRNLPDVKLVNVRFINVYDLLNADHIVLTAESLHVITGWLAPQKVAAKEKGAK